MMTYINTGVQSWTFLSLQMCLQSSFFIPMEASSLYFKKEKCSGILFYHRVLSSHDVYFMKRGQFAVLKNKIIHRTEQSRGQTMDPPQCSTHEPSNVGCSMHHNELFKSLVLKKK